MEVKFSKEVIRIMRQNDENTLGYRVGQALNGVISKQPVKNAGKVDKQPAEASKTRESVAKGYTAAQKGKFNRSYPVNVVNKAIAKMGGI